MSKIQEKIPHSEYFHQANKGEYLGDFVYGANDGIITTFAMVAGAAGASFAPGIVIILGLANLIADGISMGLSNFLSLRSKQEYQKREREIEEVEVEKFPERESKEVEEIIQTWGIPKNEADIIVKAITGDKTRWVSFMMREELGIMEMMNESPAKHAMATGIAFVIAGILPLAPYLFSFFSGQSFLASILATATALFTVGSLRSLVTSMSWFRSGLEMLLVGGVAASAAYGIGGMVKYFFGVIV